MTNTTTFHVSYTNSQDMKVEQTYPSLEEAKDRQDFLQMQGFASQIDVSEMIFTRRSLIWKPGKDRAGHVIVPTAKPRPMPVLEGD